jgi:hypothetical protein
MPAQRIRGKEMREKLCDNADLVRLAAVDSVVLISKGGFEKIGPHAVELAQPFANQAIEFLIRAFLIGRFDDHGRKH